MKTNSIGKIIAGTIQNTRREHARQRCSRFGLGRNGREMENVFDINEIKARDAMEDDAEEFRREWGIVLSFIGENAKNEKDYLLLVNRFIRGTAIKRLASELSINYRTARVKVYRARRYLLGSV